MPDREIVSAATLESSRRRAAQVVGDWPMREGWSVDERRAGLVVAQFDRLQLRPGLRLVTCAQRSAMGGVGWTSAIPSTAPAPAPADLDHEHGVVPPPLPDALPHVMEAVDGDGSLAAYVQASILGRELAEIGAWWHGLDWRTHVLLAPSDDPAVPVAAGASPYVHSALATAEPEDWTWTSPPPGDWRPGAVRDAVRGDVVVEFWTCSELGAATIYAHRDVYDAGSSLVPSRVERRPLGHGQGGFVF